MKVKKIFLNLNAKNRFLAKLISIAIGAKSFTFAVQLGLKI